MTTTTNNKMVNVFTQTYEDDMPEYISIYDRPKRSIGRPKNKIQLTDEEKVLRMRRLASKNYYENIEKRKLQQSLNYQRLKNEKLQKP
jgi:hypothetical protein